MWEIQRDGERGKKGERVREREREKERMREGGVEARELGA